MAVLVKFSKSWADEFNVHGFKFYELKYDFLKEYKEFKEGESEYYFGTNEGWDNSEIEIDDFHALEIGEDYLNALYKMFPSTQFGHFPF